MVCPGPFETGKERGRPDVDGEVAHEPARGRFVVRSGGSESPLIYVPGEGGIVEFRSTWVDPPGRGSGTCGGGSRVGQG